MTRAEELHGQEHVEVYRRTDGAEGHLWRKGTTILLLTTTGRRTGAERTSALIYRRHGDDYLVVASAGGSPTPPAWYLNLQANPTVQVQVLADRFTATARDATPDEKPEMWALMTQAWPGYDDYQRQTDREIPVVVLRRA